MNRCDDVRVELGGYVLGGLDDATERRVSAHVRECQECRAELDELAVLPGLLALVRDPTPDPPVALRSRVLATAPRGRPVRRWVVGLAAAGVVAVLVLTVSVGSVWQRGPTGVALEVEPGPAFDVDSTATVAATDDTVVVHLTFAGLGPPPEGGVYEVWLAPTRAGEWGEGGEGGEGWGDPVSIGTFAPDEHGEAVVSLEAEGPLDRYATLWVTAEPDTAAGAHDGPTVVVAEIPALP